MEHGEYRWPKKAGETVMFNEFIECYSTETSFTLRCTICDANVTATEVMELPDGALMLPTVKHNEGCSRLNRLRLATADTDGRTH